MSQWQNIYKHLKLKGFDVYSPGQHQGECMKPYVVLKDAGVNPLSEFSSSQALYDVMCYVPKERFSTLEPYVEQVKEAMHGLYPAIIPMHFQTASFLDEDVKGHMISIQYRNNRKN
jgi:hypothetical protein